MKKKESTNETFCSKQRKHIEVGEEMTQMEEAGFNLVRKRWEKLGEEGTSINQ